MKRVGLGGQEIKTQQLLHLRESARVRVTSRAPTPTHLQPEPEPE